MLREAGELQATLSNSSLEAAYAVSPQVVIHAAGFLRDGNDLANQRTAGAWLGEAGAGVFGNLLHRDVRWTLLAGAGGGRTWWEVTGDDPREYAASAVRGFLQPNIGWVSPYFELVGSARVSGVRYLSFDASGFSPDQAAQDGLTAANVTGPLWLFLEPGVTAKVGYRWVKVFAQYQWTFKMSEAPLPYQSSGLTIGLALDLAKWHGDWSF